MLSVIIWLWAILCSNPNYTTENQGNSNTEYSTTASSPGTGGETGGHPTPPPPPPKN